MAFSHSGTVGGKGLIPPKYIKNRQRLMSLDITDNINENYYLASHYIEFCRPLPTDHFDCTAPDATPNTSDCGVFTKDLKDFPLDNLPSGGPCTSDMRISPGEMAYVYIEFNQYPAGNPVTMIWTNRDTGEEIYRNTVTLPPPDPSWTWWYGYAWSFIGHFSWEIVSSGNYRCEITTPYWGNALIDFVVVNTVGSLAIASTPSNARIWIDNVDRGLYTPYTVHNLVAGDHSYKLVLAGYADLTGNFTIIPESTTPVSKIVKFNPSAYFTSDPTNARIWLDNVDTSTNTPSTLVGLTEGTHSYKLVLSPYPDIEDTFIATAGSTATIPSSFLQGEILPITASNSIKYRSDDVINGGGLNTFALMKEIVLTADYEGSIRIYYEDLILYSSGSDYTQIYKNELPWGNAHTCQPSGFNFITVSQDFGTEQNPVSLANGTRIQIYGKIGSDFAQLYVQNFRVMFDLPPGNVLVTSSPTGARIWIDGVDQGIDTPNTISGIQPGQRNYTLTKTGYANKYGIVQVDMGLTSSISETLIQYKAITASNIIRYSDDESGNTSAGGSGVPVKVKEIIIPYAYTGSWRIYFELGCIDLIDGCRYAGLSSRGQIYKDDVPYGIMQNTGNSEWCCSGFTQDFTGIDIYPDTKIQLYVDYCCNSETYTVYQNFRIMFDLPVNTISITPTSSTILVEHTQLLNVECRDEFNIVIPCNNLIWTSSDPAKATVDPTGLVTGISSGVVDITCSSGDKVSNPSVITIIIPAPILDTITIATQSESVIIPNTLQLTSICKDQYDTLMDCPTLTWESSDPIVASVDSTGLVSGILPGTTNITARSGSIVSNILMITITITPPELSIITISATSEYVTVSNTLQLTSICKDQYDTLMDCPTLTWESSDPMVASVDSTGLVSGILPGTTNITARSGSIVSNILMITISSIPASGDSGVIILVAAAIAAAAITLKKK